MVRALLSSLALLVLTGCPEYESVSYRIDLQAKTIAIVARDLRSDDPTDLDQDFATVARTVHDPSEEEGLSNIQADMREEDGELVVRWSAEFDELSAIDVYKHDRKSPYIWCPEGGSDVEITTETGVVPKALKGCVVFGRKSKVLEFTVHYDVEGSVSLLPQFRASQSTED